MRRCSYRRLSAFAAFWALGLGACSDEAEPGPKPTDSGFSQPDADIETASDVAIDGGAADDVDAGNPLAKLPFCLRIYELAGPNACNMHNNDPCVFWACDHELEQCVKTFPTTKCNDGELCSADDRCKDGKCVGGAWTCDCKTNSDCAKLEDGNLCNGTLRCDSEGVMHKCVVDLSTVVTCTQDGDPCTLAKCDPALGTCVKTPLDGAACDDGDPCSGPDKCGGGVCDGGGDQCTCKNDADCAPPGGENACTGKRFCDKAHVPFWACAVVPGTQVTCTTAPEDAQCAETSCNPKFGACVKEPLVPMIGKPCDDGDPCTAQTICDKGKCSGGKSKDCTDGNICTTDTCATIAGQQLGACAHSPNTLPCNDQSKCTEGETCKDLTCVATAKHQVSCDDSDSCTQDSCAPKTGCAHVTLPDKATCDDGDLCTVGDLCAAGKCYGGNAKDCDDGDKCTTDESCAKGNCGPGKPVDCDDGNVCSTDSCEKSLGCVHTANSLPCLPKAACLAQGQCVLGACKSGKPRLFSVQLAANKKRAVHAIVEDSEAGLWLGGGQLDKADGPSDGFLWRLGPDGTPHEELVLASKGKGGVRGLALLGTDIIAAGGYQSAGVKHGWVLRHKPEGIQPTWTLDLGGSGVAVVEAVAVQPASKAVKALIVAAGAGTAKGQPGRVEAVDPGGKLLWSASYNTSGPAAFVGIAADVGAAVAVGSAAVGTWQRGLVARAAAGSIGWATQLSRAGRHVHVRAVAAALRGWLIAGHDTDGKGTADAWVRLVAKDGGVVWRKEVGKPGLGGVGALVAQEGGGFALVGRTGLSDSGSSDGWLALLHPLGDPAGPVRTFSGPSVQALTSLAALKDGGLAAGGVDITLPSTVQRAWLVRTDRWGHPTCDEAGECVSKSAVDCGADACHLAGCTKAKGCSKEAVALPCDDGKLCTVDEQCAAGKCTEGEPRLWQKSFGGKAGDRLLGVAAVAGGDVVIAGQSAATGKADGLLARLSPGGKPRWKTHWGPANGAILRDVLVQEDGVIAAAGEAGTSKTATAGWLLRTGTDGKLASLQTFAESKVVVKLRGVAQWLDGGYVLVGDAAPEAGVVHVGYAIARWADADGKQSTTSKDMPLVLNKKDRFSAVVVDPAGHALVVGTAEAAAKGASDGWFVRMAQDGKLLVNVLVGGPLGDGLHDIAVGAGGAVAVGFKGGSKGDRAWIVGLTLAGGVQFEHVLGDGKQAMWSIQAIHGGFLLAGEAPFDGFSQQAVAWRLDGAAQLVMSRSLGQHTAARGIVALAGGDLVVAGLGPLKDDPTKHDAWAARVDRHGNTACHVQCATPASGAANPCDDNNPCTFDVCNGANGKCLLVPAPFDLPCGPGKTCQLGKCL